MSHILAYDRVGTVRTVDEDGRLKVARTPISKANVCPYYGREIPNHVELGLDPDKLYQLLRDPYELSKAADTFNGLPVLEEHFHVTADNPRRDLQIGATGEGAEFESPYLYNSLTVWDGDAIERIKSGEQRELSSAYRYDPDMTPGEYDGEKYDGVMRNIRGSHVAVVPQGRAGPDVLVADSKPNMDIIMAKHKPSKTDELLKRIRPFLAQDADIEACKSAMDEEGEMDDDVAEDVDANLEKSREDRLKAAGFSPDEIAKMCASLDTAEDDVPPCDDPKPAEDEQDETDRQDEREGEERHLDRERRDREDERAGEERYVARERKDRRDESEGAKAAMDAAVREVERRVTALHEAREAVKPVVGIVAMDSAEAVYGFALKQAGYKLSDIPKAAYKPMFEQHIAQIRRAETAKPRLGMDSKAGVSFLDKFPGLKRINKG